MPIIFVQRLVQMNIEKSMKYVTTVVKPFIKKSENAQFLNIIFVQELVIGNG